MKFLKFSIAALLMPVVFVACEKDKDVISKPPQEQSPVPAPVANPVQGIWMGNRYGLTKSIPVYFGFQIKAQGKLDILNPAKQVIGSGDWKFDNNVFTATYTITSSGDKYSVKSGTYDSQVIIGGTWGFDNNTEGGGFWEMEKIN